jgi:hypothetical protein
MTDTNPTLSFNDKTYNISDLSEEVKQTISALQVATNQVQIYQDTLNVLLVGRSTLVSSLEAQLAGVEPVAAPVVEEVKEEVTQTKTKIKCPTKKPNVKRLKVDSK